MIDYKTVKQIDCLLKSKTFSGLTELMAFLLMAEKGSLTSNEAYKKIGAHGSYMRNVLSQMKIKGLVNSVDDKDDKNRSALVRQIYSLSSKGSSLYRRIQDGAESE